MKMCVPFSVLSVALLAFGPAVTLRQASAMRQSQETLISVDSEDEGDICFLTEKKGHSQYGVSFAFPLKAKEKCMIKCKPSTFFPSRLSTVLEAEANGKKCICSRPGGSKIFTYTPMKGDECNEEACWLQYSSVMLRGKRPEEKKTRRRLEVSEWLSSQNHWDAKCDERGTTVMPSVKDVIINLIKMHGQGTGGKNNDVKDILKTVELDQEEMGDLKDMFGDLDEEQEDFFKDPFEELGDKIENVDPFEELDLDNEGFSVDPFEELDLDNEGFSDREEDNDAVAKPSTENDGVAKTSATTTTTLSEVEEKKVCTKLADALDRQLKTASRLAGDVSKSEESVGLLNEKIAGGFMKKANYKRELAKLKNQVSGKVCSVSEADSHIKFGITLGYFPGKGKACNKIHCNAITMMEKMPLVATGTQEGSKCHCAIDEMQIFTYTPAKSEPCDGTSCWAQYSTMLNIAKRPEARARGFPNGVEGKNWIGNPDHYTATCEDDMEISVPTIKDIVKQLKADGHDSEAAQIMASVENEPEDILEEVKEEEVWVNDGSATHEAGCPKLTAALEASISDTERLQAQNAALKEKAFGLTVRARQQDATFDQLQKEISKLKKRIGK